MLVKDQIIIEHIAYYMLFNESSQCIDDSCLDRIVRHVDDIFTILVNAVNDNGERVYTTKDKPMTGAQLQRWYYAQPKENRAY